MSRLRSGQMLYALAQHFDWFRNKMMPEWYVDGGIADLVFVSRAGYVTEIEIKTSRSDWNADAAKRKWSKPRPYITRFFYAVSAEMASDIPKWIALEVGILAVNGTTVREVRPAKRLKAKPLTDKQLQHFGDRCYYRFWHAEMRRLRENIWKAENKRVLAEQREAA